MLSSRRQTAESEKRKGLRHILQCAVVVISLPLFQCSGQGGSENNSKFNQYYNQGEQLYTKHCSNCHQINGKGLGRIYPPLDSSDYMVKNFESVVCLIRYGKKGELIVNGKDFNQAMPGIPSLTDLEIAEITTYIYNTWQHKRGIVEVKEVSSILNNCSPETDQ